MNNRDYEVHGANIGPIFGQQDPGGPNVGPMNFAIWDIALIYPKAVIPTNWQTISLKKPWI